MTISFYLKLAVAIFFVAMPYFASATVEPEKISPVVRYVADQYGERLSKFNRKPLRPDTYEHHTHNIQRTLKNVDERRHASDKEKELILKAVMGSVVIHGNDSTYRLPAHRLKEGNSRFRHFEILRLTEKLAVDLMGQLSTGFMDINALTGYENLYDFSGKDVNIFKKWFEDVVNKHSPGLIKQMNRRVDGLRFDVQSVGRVGQMYETSTFGDIGAHSIAGRNVVFVSTYAICIPSVTYSVLIRIPGKSRYIVIQQPYFDNSQGSNYTIRAHALVNGETDPRDVNVNISITNGKNGKSEVGITNLESGRVYSHDRTFSPGNMCLTGLPDRSLENGEVFSFTSKINGDSKMIDTLHIITDNAYPAVTLAKTTSNLGDFLRRLSRVHEIFGADTLSHLAKMMAFIEGQI